MAEEALEVQQEPIEKPKEPDKKPEPEKSGEDVKDSHGQPGINKERHDREVNELKATIKELQGKLDEMAKTEAGREDFEKRARELEQKVADMEIDHSLELARCRNNKAARALLGDYGGDVAKLKEAEPWLFQEEKPTGSTGLPPTGAAQAADALENELRAAAGLKKKG